MRDCVLTNKIYDVFDLYCKETATKQTKDNLAHVLNVEPRYFSRHYSIDPNHLLAIALYNKYYEPPQFTTTALTDFNNAILRIATSALTDSTHEVIFDICTLKNEQIKRQPRLLQQILRTLKQKQIIKNQSDVLDAVNISKREHYENKTDSIKNLVKFILYCQIQKGNWLRFVDLIQQQILLRFEVYFKSLEFNRQRNTAQIYGRFKSS